MKLVRGANRDDDVDALFKLPLAEFTGARNALAAQLKKSGRGDDAARVKALAKPSVSAWAVNQLYWNNREAFDRLIESGKRFHKVQASRGGGKMADMRTALDERRESLTELSDLATSLLQRAGQNPSLDTIRRITTTLEGLSAYAARTDGPRPGRLTSDVDPPGFESLAGFGSGAGVLQLLDKPARDPSSRKISSAPANTHRKTSAYTDARRDEEMRKTRVAAAKASLQKAKQALIKARAKAQSLEPAQKKADAEAKKTEKHRREVEASAEKARFAAETAAKRARGVAVEVEEAATALEDAELAVAARSKELESLFGSR